MKAGRMSAVDRKNCFAAFLASRRWIRLIGTYCGRGGQYGDVKSGCLVCIDREEVKHVLAIRSSRRCSDRSRSSPSLGVSTGRRFKSLVCQGRWSGMPRPSGTPIVAASKIASTRSPPNPLS